jgi:hypothetical protein
VAAITIVLALAMGVAVSRAAAQAAPAKAGLIQAKLVSNDLIGGLRSVVDPASGRCDQVKVNGASIRVSGLAA